MLVGSTDNITFPEAPYHGKFVLHWATELLPIVPIPLVSRPRIYVYWLQNVTDNTAPGVLFNTNNFLTSFYSDKMPTTSPKAADVILAIRAQFNSG